MASYETLPEKPLTSVDDPGSVNNEAVIDQAPAESAVDPKEGPVCISQATCGQKLSDRLPGVEGPTVYFEIKNLTDSSNYQKTFNLIKMFLDKSQNIMGKTGEHFCYSLDFNSDKNFSVVTVEGDRELTETLGLAVTLENGKIVLIGTPLTGFDGQLHFSFARFDHSDGGDTHRKPMYIAADPRSLWLDLPVEDPEGYPVDDEAWEARPLLATGKIVVAASCRGRSHAHAAKPRDDSFHINSDSGSGWNFLAVADGAGSSRFSRKGSMLACETVLGTLKQSLLSPEWTGFFQANQERLIDWKQEFESANGDLDPAIVDKYHQQIYENSGMRLNDLVYNAVYTGYMSIEQEARARQVQVRDYHTTLICAAFKKFPFGFFIISYWVGDGAMAVYGWNHNNRVLVPGIPDGGEFAGQTRFLTMGREEINPETVAKRTRFIFADDFESLILVTDGITDAFFPSEKKVLDEAEWRNFWTRTLPIGDADTPPCPELYDDQLSLDNQSLALRRWLNFWSKGNHDDRTILIVK